MATFKKVKEQNFIELCETGTLQEIQSAIDSGIDVNALDEFGENALHIAAAHGAGVPRRAL